MLKIEDNDYNILIIASSILDSFMELFTVMQICKFKFAQNASLQKTTDQALKQDH